MSQDTLETLQAILSDRYRVERILGSGGMATVYLAHDLKHHRPVAIKVLRPELAAILGRERFLREIEIVAGLNHPHILPLHDSGAAGELLYYVMPYVEGETLLERLRREKQLPVEDAVRIGREVASALAYAHARDVVHRDIKPGNILLSGGFALVSDFGLARAINRSQNALYITQSGFTIGTPAYMSPEQASGDDELDRRSDIYSLGCVLYELLAGDPPFSASTPRAVMARQAGAAVIPLRTIRPAVPERLEAAVLRALEKAPADWFQTAEELERALAGALEPAGLPRPRRRAPVYIGLGMGALIILTVWLSTRGPPGAGPAPSDTTRYAVFPFDYASDVELRLNERPALEQAVLAWSGVQLADPVRLEEELRGRQPDAGLSRQEAQRIARAVGAGRYIRGELTRTGDSLRVRASVYEPASRPDPIYEAIARVPASPAGFEQSVRVLAARLLLRDDTVLPDQLPTRSLPAWQLAVSGNRMLTAWRLEEADSAFSGALRYDPEFGHAALWLALARAWSGAPSGRWLPLVRQAARERDRLDGRQHRIALALEHQAERTWDQACPVWGALAREQRDDFIAWFGLAQCLGSDHVLVPDRRSPSGWRFRSSPQQAVLAYRRAFELQRATPGPGSRLRFDQLRTLLFTRAHQVWSGRAQSGGQFFLSQPGWVGDSLVFIPHPAEAFSRGDPGTQTPTRQTALLRQRRMLNELTTTWVAAQPNDPAALGTLGLSLQLLGDPSALDTLRRARTLAAAPADRIRLAADEIWLRVARMNPDQLDGVRMLQALGDSLLADPDPEHAAILEPVAALLGRTHLAARLSSQVGIGGGGPLQRSLVRDAPALLIYAALGGPADSIRKLAGAVAAAIEQTTLAEERGRVQQEWLIRAARLAFPEVRLDEFIRFGPAGDALFEAQTSLARGDREPAERYLDRQPSARRYWSPEEVAPEALLAESRLLLVLGDTARAAAWLNPMLASFGRIDPDLVSRSANAASLARAILLRADLAARQGDREQAQRWARLIATLWSGADLVQQPAVRRMEQLAGPSPLSSRRP